MIEDEEEEEENDDEDVEMSPPDKKPKTDMVHKTFTWTEWDQKLEGDRVKGKSELQEKTLLFVWREVLIFICMLFVVSMNVPYTHIKAFLVNWLDPEDAGEIGLEDMRRAKKNGKRMAKCHDEMATLPRCAQHGTVLVKYTICFDCMFEELFNGNYQLPFLD